MRFHPRDFGFEKGDTFGELFLRIWAEIFANQQRGGVTLRARTIIVFHTLHNPPLPGCCQQGQQVMHRRFWR